MDKNQKRDPKVTVSLGKRKLQGLKAEWKTHRWQRGEEAKELGVETAGGLLK